jgi:hypothetical protein
MRTPQRTVKEIWAILENPLEITNQQLSRDPLKIKSQDLRSNALRLPFDQSPISTQDGSEPPSGEFTSCVLSLSPRTRCDTNVFLVSITSGFLKLLNQMLPLRAVNHESIVISVKRAENPSQAAALRNAFKL